MKVCIDVQSAVAQRAGVGRYTRLLVKHLDSCIEDDRLLLFYFDFKKKGQPVTTRNASEAAVRWCPGRLAQAAWKKLRWPPFNWLAGKSDVYHFPNFVLPPLTTGRSVVTIHDMSFLRYPEFAETRNLRYLSSSIQHTVNRSDAIITDSNFSAMEIRELLNIGADRVFPIHLGVSDEIKPPAEEAVHRSLESFGIDRPYILTVSTLEPRKNIPFLVDVFEKLDFFDGYLVVVGMPGWKFQPIIERIRGSTRANDIRYLKYVPDSQLPALYAGAELFMFTSLYEGFGFTPLEAMACGTPVISSTGGSLGEVLGDGADMINDFSLERWVDRAQRVLGDSALRSALVDRGRKRVSMFKWSETAAKTLGVYRRLAGQ